MAAADVHPKTAAAAVGVGIGGAVVAVLQACGVHVPAELAAALSSLLSAVLAYLAPSPDPAPAALWPPHVGAGTANQQIRALEPPRTDTGADLERTGDQLPWRSPGN